jgi:hypothetical protein
MSLINQPTNQPTDRKGAGFASMEALRPQAVMTLCEILHHCRKSLTLDQLGRVVRLMTAYVVDQVGWGHGGRLSGWLGQDSHPGC